MSFIYEKQPTEVEPVSIDFKRRLPEGDSVGSASISAIDLTDGNTVTSTIVHATSIDQNVVTAVLKAGVNGRNYKITFLATTTPSSYKLEDDVIMQVREK